MDSAEPNILSFYDELRQLFLNILDEEIILFGDLNARMGRYSQTRKYLGSHGLGKANSTISSLETRGFAKKKKNTKKVRGNTHALDTGI